MNKLFISILFFCAITVSYASRYEYKKGQFKYYPNHNSDVSRDEVDSFKIFMDNLNEKFDHDLKIVVRNICHDHLYKQYEYNTMSGSFSVKKDSGTVELNFNANNNHNHHNIKLGINLDDKNENVHLSLDQNNYFDLCELVNYKEQSPSMSEWELYDNDNGLVLFDYNVTINFPSKKGGDHLTLVANDMRVSLDLPDIKSADKIVKFISASTTE